MKGRRFFLFALFVIFLTTFDPSRAQSCTTTKNNQVGECKFINDCAEVLQAFRLKKEPPTVCDFRSRTVCCPKQKTTSTSTTTQKPKERISKRKCREYSNNYRYEIKIVPSSIINDPPVEKRIPHCLHDVVPLIVGGEEAKLREFPHMALIGFGEGKEDDYQCGGSLIAEQWVLSAAHCISANGDPANFAKLGHVVRYQSTQNSYIYKIIERIKHPDYNSKFGDDDIVLFKLEKPATLNSYVIPICLPSANEFKTKKVIATGYGRTDTADDVSQKLMKVIIEYMNSSICNEQFEYSGKFASNHFDSRKMVCAGSANKSADACQGDSGGPLQIYHDESIYCMHQIVGITSFGFAYCGIPGVPAVYTKVYHYLDWIESVVWPNQ